ncbi:MAG: hypothetical protein RLZZ127_314 [Planctomycetota bacterium]
MIALDTNILVHAHRRDADRHGPAAAAVRGLAEGRQPWGIPAHALIEFGGVVTHARIFPRPSTVAEAWAQVEAWLASPSVRLLGDTAESLAGAYRLLGQAAARGPRIHDARIAAVCLAHGVKELWTIDRDFSAFAPLRTRDPTAG